MTLLEKLKALYDEDPLDADAECRYCNAAHDPLCVWAVTQEAIAALEHLEAKRKALTEAWVEETRAALVAELQAIAAFIRAPGNIWREDAVDECARVLENRAAHINEKRGEPKPSP